jgi:uncharacterized protein involved in exopolysaccharide biosynthesis
MTNKEGVPNRQAVLVFVDEATDSGDAYGSLLQLVVRYWVLIATCAVIAGVGAITYSLIASKWYRAQATVAPARQDASGSSLGALGGQIGGLASLVGVDIGDGEDQRKETLGRLASREFTYDFLRAEGIVPILFADKWNATTKSWKSPAKAPTIEDAYREFTGRVFTVSEDRRTGLIKITVDWTDPELAMTWANKLVMRINADRRAVARSESERSLEFLSRELEKTGIVELRQAINRMVESEIRKQMLVNVREEYAFKVIDPAFMPGPHSVVRPRIAMYTALGLIIGGLLGFGIALVRHSRRGK